MCLLALIVLDAEGQGKVYLFGQMTKQFSGESYTKESQELLDTELTGMYYSDQPFSGKVKRELSALNLRYLPGDFGWWLTPVDFLFGNLRSFSVWTLFFVFGVLLFAVKMIYIKKAMIQRSLGLFRKQMWRAVVADIGILIGTTVIVMVLFALIQGSLTSVFVKSFTLVSGINLLILLGISGLVNGLFALNVKLMNAVAVLKNRSSQNFISYIWLMGILLSFVIFGVTVNESVTVVRELTNQVSTLGNWEKAQDFVRITWFDTLYNNAANDHEISQELFLEDGNKKKAFVQLFKQSEFLYSKPSSLAYETVQNRPEFQQSLQNERLDTRLASRIQYVNSGLLLKNKQIYPQNNYGLTTNQPSESPVTIYIPNSYLKDIQQVKQIIAYEWFQYTTITIDNMLFYEIPDRQQTFLFNQTEGQQEVFARQVAQDKILVELNFSEFPNESALLTQYNQVAFDGLFQQGKVKENIAKAGLQKNFSTVTNASKDILLKREKIVSQLSGTIMALLVLSSGQFFVVYHYVTARIKSQARRMVIKNILGNSILTEVGRTLSPLIIGILFVSLVVLVQTTNVLLTASLCGLYFVEISTMTLLALREIKKKRVQIIKGDFEIL